MKTKYFWMFLVALVIGTQVMNAQSQPGRKGGRKRMTMEQMMEMKCKRLVEDLKLDDTKAARFTDVYQKYMKEMKDVRKNDTPRSPRVRPQDGQKPEAPTDAEVEKRMRARFAQSRQILDIREKYYDEFRKFLSPKQVEEIYGRGQMDHGKFKKEKNRRAGLKQNN